MAVMRQGQFVQQGTPEEIMNNPADEYVERLLLTKGSCRVREDNRFIFPVNRAY